MSMQDAKKLAKAVTAAEVFIESAKKIQSCSVEYETWHSAGPKETGQCRRDSMDLTRALAELRNRNAG